MYIMRLLKEPRVSTSASMFRSFLSRLHKIVNLIIFLPETFHGMGKLCIIISSNIDKTYAARFLRKNFLLLVYLIPRGKEFHNLNSYKRN